MQRPLLSIIFWIAAALGVRAAEVMPPKPARWFNDYAGVVPADTVRQLDAKLEQFERDTSNQVVVAVWRDMQSDSSAQDYTFRIFQQWQLGQRGRDNGIGLFVFVAPRTMFMQVGYGLEGAVSDVIAKRIIEDEIAPYFKTGNYGAGFTAGVNAILAAAKGEYKGTGGTAGDIEEIPLIVWIILFFIALNVIASVVHYMRRGLEISGKGRRWQGPVDTFPTIFSGGGGSSWGGSGGWSSGGGGFSGGGGRSGGGGAGGSW